MNNTVITGEKPECPVTSTQSTEIPDLESRFYGSKRRPEGIYDTDLREVRLTDWGTLKNETIPNFSRSTTTEPPKEYMEDSTFLDDLLVIAGVNQVSNEYDGSEFDDCESECDTIRYSKCGEVDLDTLKLSGVVPSEWTEEDFPEEEQDYKVKLLKRACANLPEKLVLELDCKHLNINGVPTKISSKAVEQAFFGLSELMGRERALVKVSNLVRKKLKCLF